ncbi:hypothetical protein YH62_25115 [Rhizobium sp. LC145]|jgi:hypothetical protein|nr:hypothetical protein YH62_25115 [Rhizobium sp. LC145]
MRFFEQAARGRHQRLEMIGIANTLSVEFDCNCCDAFGLFAVFGDIDFRSDTVEYALTNLQIAALEGS